MQNGLIVINNLMICLIKVLDANRNVNFAIENVN